MCLDMDTGVDLTRASTCCAARATTTDGQLSRFGKPEGAVTHRKPQRIQRKDAHEFTSVGQRGIGNAHRGHTKGTVAAGGGAS